MRIRRLSLVRYGQFTDVPLCFRPDASLHVVYGENEAGKTTALNAIVDLLYGFGKFTKYDFKHPQALLVGATLENRAGEAISFNRRKGIKRTLTNLTGTVLADDALAPYLGAISEEAFKRSWGLSKEELRAGGEEMLKSEGEAGASLFAAASGLKGLLNFQKRLESEAASIFAPAKAQSRIFYQAHDRFETAAKLVRELGFRASDLKERIKLVETSTQAWEKAKSDRADCIKLKGQLERQKGLMPLLRLNLQDEAALNEWDGLPPISGSAVVELRRALNASQAAKQKLGGLENELEGARKRLSGFEFDQMLLDHSATVDLLIQKLGEYSKHKLDLPGIERERDGYVEELHRNAISLGLPSTANLEEHMPTELLIADVRAQVTTGREVANNLSSKRASIGQETLTADRLKKQQTNQGAASDPKSFRDKLSRLMPNLGQLSERDRLDLLVSTEATEVNEKAAQLAPPVTDLDGLAQLSLPSRETISDYQEQLKALESEYKILESRVSAAQSTVQRLQDELDKQDNAPLEASEENILAVRTSRNGHWQSLRAVLLEEIPPLSHAETATHVVGFEEGLSLADRLSDEAVQNAGVLTTYAIAVNRLNEEKRTLQRAEEELGRKKLEVEELSAKWTELWSLCGLQAKRPNKMAEWLTEVQNLLIRRTKLLGEKKKLAQIDEAVTIVRPSLISLGKSLGIAEAAELATGLLLSAVGGEVEIRTQAWNNSADLVTRLNDTRDRLDVLEDERDELLVQMEVWSTNWRSLLASMHLPPGTTVEGASAAIEVWGKVPGTLKLYQTAKRRVDGMNRDIDAYSDQVFRLIVELGAEGLGTEADMAVKGLAQRLVSAKKEAAKAEQTAQDITALERKVSQAEGEHASAAGNLEALSVKLPETATRGEQVAALEAREAVLQRLRERRNTVSSLSQGQSEEEMRAASEKFDEESASIEILNLETQETVLSEDISKAYAQMKKVQDELDQLQKGIGAEAAVQKQKIAEAEMVQNARTWAVKRFAQILLAQVVEQYRSQQEQPLLKRAGEFFSLLTALRFTGIEHQFDDNDTAHLLGKRNNNESIHVDGMSEGTRDQLYLALRLAYLEEYAGNAEPMPFIGDDLLTSFDDRRATAGLEALATISSKVQPILFTHHSRIVELARQSLGNSVDIVNLV
jgi:uncharacterized protein YhaN